MAARSGRPEDAVYRHDSKESVPRRAVGREDPDVHDTCAVVEERCRELHPEAGEVFSKGDDSKTLKSLFTGKIELFRC
jgi:hypothetical protein